ncbi:MAG: methyl-accepting chemotaxis protein, partial [Actinobacteria bacterium]|nr:methyl-accepting chemotaxis protein [Actinomycetota bacterium]
AVEVMDGDLDVQVPIKPHEEFSELKSAFNNMVSSLSGILSKSLSPDAGSEPEQETEDKEKAKSEQIFKPRSTILFQVISLFIVVFLVAGGISLLFVNSALNSLVKNSKDELIRTQAEYVALIHEHGVELSAAASSVGTRDPAEYNKLIQDFINALSTKTESELTRESNAMFERMVEWGLMDIKVIYVVLAPTQVFGNDYMVIVGSDNNYLYSEPPQEVVEMLEEGKETYKLFPDGFEEMGIDEPCLVNLYRFSTDMVAPGSSLSSSVADLWSVQYIPMGKKIADTDSYYSEKKNSLLMTIGIVIWSSVLLMIIITILSLRYLLRKNITGPIDDLTEIIREVAAGNLDAQVGIKPGEDLEGLKRAFTEMINSFRKIIDRSSGES